ncbi:substrate-binding domain-containing protein [Sphingosinicella sp. LHD-64]|uniref:substrate-binding domain-containing protein n=1 Tax=Sphingosinicella sp. LHD-64 TaxID=3072139 RepID=UPI00280EB2D1|nr:substrate-binding domain-containing protein [Sphingosinicella sp. LHD-64]MDQ8754987.1 substrate-binding domain-containing protein [Sphingosinicella sp. LHD-64]
MRKQLLPALGFLFALAACGQSSASVEEQRDHILAAGSSTVYPFTRAVAEEFQRKNAGMAAPVIQSTGTGAGFEAFCGGLGARFPDLVDASRRIHPDELAQCRTNGVVNITELQIGMDGVALAQSPAAPPIRLTRIELYEALAANPYGEPNQKTRWNQVNPNLPDIPILVYGPPATSGTRESLAELLLIGGCQADARMRALKAQDEAGFHRLCTEIRGDGLYQESGEDDERLSQMLVVNPGAIGIFGYGTLERAGSRLRAVPIDGIMPDATTIAAGRYSGARPLYIYVKGDRVDSVPGLRMFLSEYAAAIGPGSYLTQRGLIPADQAVRRRTAESATRLIPLTPAALR